MATITIKILSLKYKTQNNDMGRNKFSQKEIDNIGKLLIQKCSCTRFRQKQIRHILRVDYEFNISDFGVQGKSFGKEDLMECVRKGIIQILDDATIEAMKAKRLRDKERDAALAGSESTSDVVDWRKVMEEWEQEQQC